MRSTLINFNFIYNFELPAHLGLLFETETIPFTSIYIQYHRPLHIHFDFVFRTIEYFFFFEKSNWKLFQAIFFLSAQQLFRR